MPIAATSQSPSRVGDVAFGDAMVRIEERQLLLNGVPAKLGARALDVLLALIQRRERVVSKNELLEVVWPGLVVEENNLQVHISALRKLLGPRAITTVPGRGYRFTAALAETVQGDQTTAAAPACAGALPAVDPPNAPPALFGRDHDLATLPHLVTAHRLVTVAGAGGMGKTSLAQAVARSLRPAFADGVWRVDLAPLTDGRQLASTVAEALSITLSVTLGAARANGASAPPAAASGADDAGANRSANALADALRDRHLLIVLDNCEHLVLPVSALVARLLQVAPKVHMLATSQEPLKLADEQVYRLSALALPLLPTLEAARQAGAVRLFEARAHACDQRFALGEDNVAAVVDICTQLDGIALAIELAAARVPLLGVHGLRDRLGQRLRLLAGGSRSAPPRHRTLRAALEWSHALLSPQQSAVFRRLGVMSGHFSLEAAQRVAALDDLDEWDVLDHLGALVDKSLVMVNSEGTDLGGPAATAMHSDGEVRYRLLETMRHFALERLAESAEEHATRDRHLAFYLALAEQAKAHLTGSQTAQWLTRLDMDRDNLLAAHAWCDRAEHGAERGLRLVTALLRYWASRALPLQGRRECLQALARPGAAVDDTLRCEALNAAAYFCLNLAMDRESVELLRESVAAARRGRLTEPLIRALSRLCVAAKNLRDLALARASGEEALRLARQTADAPTLVMSATISLGELERLEGNVDAALALCEESLACARAAGDRLIMLITLGNLAMVSIVAHRPARARELLAEMLAIADELGARRGHLTVMEAAAGLAAQLGQHAVAVRFESAADTHIAQIGGVRDVTDMATLAPLIELARQSLGDGGHAQAMAGGRTLPFDDAVCDLRAWLTAGAGAVTA